VVEAIPRYALAKMNKKYLTADVRQISEWLKKLGLAGWDFYCSVVQMKPKRQLVKENHDRNQNLSPHLASADSHKRGINYSRR
jgi:hypothetical protein